MDLDLPVLVPVEGHPDLVRFEADLGFTRDQKALASGDEEYDKYMPFLEDGDLLIAGWGANFEMDRENEAFEDGAFTRGLKAFLAGEAVIDYHHQHDKVLGKVLDAIPVEGKGVRLIARVDNQPESSPLRHLYQQVKKGTLNAFSAGGFFRRKLTANGPRITDVDLTSWTITGVPVGRGCNFQVVAGKALSDLQFPGSPQETEDIRAAVLEFETKVRAAVEGLDSIVTDITKLFLDKKDVEADEESTEDSVETPVTA